MRKITQEAVQAWNNNEVFGKQNTVIIKAEFGIPRQMLLFGNCIAKQDKGILEVNHQGYLTNTTKERLNGLPGVHIKQIKGIWYLNGTEMLNGWNKV